MKIVIDISEEEYELVRHGNKSYTTELELMNAVANGIPLPEHHGRLIDADALYDSAKLCHAEEDGTACVEWREINDAETIIEADKESKE